MDIEYRRLEISEQGIRECSEFLNRVFRKYKPKTPAYLTWEYMDNPVGFALGFNAYHNHQLIAHYVAQPILSRIFGAEMKGLFALHVATDPAFRGKGLFFEVNARTHQLAADLGFKFVIGVANQNSTPLYKKKLGFNVVSPLHTYISVGLPGSVDRTSDDVQYTRIWDTETSKWRMQNPNNDYAVYSKKGNLIIGKTHHRGIKVIMKSCLANNGVSQIQTIKPRFPGLYLWYGLGNELDWAKTLHVNLPQRLRPSPLNLIFKSLADIDLSFDPAKMIFNPLDHDGF